MKVEGSETRRVEVNVRPINAVRALRLELCRKLDAPSGAYMPNGHPALSYAVTLRQGDGMWVKNTYDPRDGAEQLPLRKATPSQVEALEALRVVEAYVKGLL